MAIFFPPPPVFTGSAQPYAPRQVDPNDLAVPANPPPPTTLRTSVSELAVLWQPSPYQQTVADSRGQPYAPRQVDPNDLNNPGQNPPFQQGGPTLNEQMAPMAWQPSPYQPVVMSPFGQPFAPRQVDPNDLNVPVNNPPTTQGGPSNLVSIVASRAYPDPWTYDYSGSAAPYSPRKQSPAVPGQSADPPPFRNPAMWPANVAAVWISQQGAVDPWGRWPYVFLGWQGPYMPKHVDPADVAVPVSNPPFGLWTRTRPQSPMLPGWNDPAQIVPQYLPHVVQITAEIFGKFGRGYILGI